MQVFVTPKAEKDLDLIIEYITYRWGDNTSKQFILKVDEILKLLKAYPLMGQVENKDIMGFQLTRHTRILYRLRANKVIILAFFDVRQHPKKRFR